MKKTLLLATFIAFALTVGASAASLDVQKLGRQYGGWHDKHGEAARFRSAGDDYRIYKPDVSREPDGGLFVSTKVDHIRGGGGDDHALLRLTFSPNGILVKAHVTGAVGDHSLDTGIIRGIGDVTLIAGGDPRIAAIANISAAVLDKMNRQFARWGESGGRANFPAVVHHALNRIANNVR